MTNHYRKYCDCIAMVLCTKFPIKTYCLSLSLIPSTIDNERAAGLSKATFEKIGNFVTWIQISPLPAGLVEIQIELCSRNLNCHRTILVNVTLVWLQLPVFNFMMEFKLEFKIANIGVRSRWYLGRLGRLWYVKEVDVL